MALALAPELVEGAGAHDGPPLAPPLAAGTDPFGDRPVEGPLVLLVIDSFGWNDFERWAEASADPLARVWRGLARPVDAAFPTTTTAGLVTLSTGVPPGRHGIVGHRQYLPRWGTVADMLRMTPAVVAGQDLLIGPEWRPPDMSGAPTLFRRGLDAVAVSRERFQGTGFTRILYDGAEYVPYTTASDFAHELVRVLERRRPPRAVFAYWDELDTVYHVRGPNPFLFAVELERAARLMAAVAARLSPELRARTTLLVTGDHGQVEQRPESRIALERHPDVIAEMRHPLGGDRRAGFFAARPGRRDALAERLRDVLPPGSSLTDMAHAVEHGLFGPPPHHPELAERLGDWLALVPPPAGITYTPPGATMPKRHPAGAHGGLDPDERLVPLVAGPLSAFG